MQRVIKEISVKTSSKGKPYALVEFDAHDDVKKASCWNEDIWKVLYDYYGKPVDLILTKNDKGYWNIERLGTEVHSDPVLPTASPLPHSVTHSPTSTENPRVHPKPDDRAYWEAKNAKDNDNIRRQVAFKGAIEVLNHHPLYKNATPEQIETVIGTLTTTFTTILEGHSEPTKPV